MRLKDYIKLLKFELKPHQLMILKAIEDGLIMIENELRKQKLVIKLLRKIFIMWNSEDMSDIDYSKLLRIIFDIED